MKNDFLTKAILDFLVPIIFLYASFCFIGFFEVGFFNVIYAATLFASGFIIILSRFSAARIAFTLHLELFSFFLLLLSICYFTAILLTITDIFAV